MFILISHLPIENYASSFQLLRVEDIINRLYSYEFFYLRLKFNIFCNQFMSNASQYPNSLIVRMLKMVANNGFITIDIHEYVLYSLFNYLLDSLSVCRTIPQIEIKLKKFTIDEYFVQNLEMLFWQNIYVDTSVNESVKHLSVYCLAFNNTNDWVTNK